MANDLSARQWHLDTPLAFGNPGAVLWPGNIKVAHMEYTDYSAQGNQAIVKDRNGKIVWAPTGAADLEEVRTAKVGWVNGIVLDTCQGGGYVTVYIE
jgi:hypothetical protein